MPAPRLRIASAAALLTTLALAGGAVGQTAPSADSKAADTRPNVVVIMTDDQAIGTMRAMPFTARAIGRRGMRFQNAVTSFPLCCPSRASFLTGQYAHNHHVLGNHFPRGGLRRLDQLHTLPIWLSRAGYRTAFIGKYLNGYGLAGSRRMIPPGWDYWVADTNKHKAREFGYKLNENGRMVGYGHRASSYKTDVFAKRATRFIDRAARGDRPFFAWIAPDAPHRDAHLPDDSHRNPVPAPRDSGHFRDIRLPHDPAINERNVSDKPLHIRAQPRLTHQQLAWIRRGYVSQLESLLAVDDLVRRVVHHLRRAGALGRTLLVFTSDNGFMFGQHRIKKGKLRPYEESVMVPLLIRGPGFPGGRRVRTPVANIDLAPTILAATGADADATVDGRALQDTIRVGSRDPVLLEAARHDDGAFVGIRSSRFKYVEYRGKARELYDLARDPHELRNRAGDRRYRRAQDRLRSWLRRLENCSGEGCR
jgi:N-acetylglucosamine-6-sulfatase